MESMSRENLIQRAADGELTTPEELAAFERHLAEMPGDGVAVEDIRQLRAAVARVMGGEIVVPTGLRERIVRALELVEVGAESTAVIGRVDSKSGQGALPRHRRPWLIPSGFAAGILLLVGAAFLISLMTKNVVDPNLLGGPGTASENEGDVDGSDGWLCTTLNDADLKLYDELGSEHGGDLSLKGHDFGFVGMKLDAEMFGGYALHYARPEDTADEAVFWLMRSTGVDFGVPVGEMIEGVGYLVASDNGGVLADCLSWRNGDVVHFFRVTGAMDGSDEVAEMARTLGMPAGEVVKMP